MYKVITPVGTSLFENCLREEGASSPLASLLGYFKHKPRGRQECDLEAAAYERQRAYVDKVKESIRNWLKKRQQEKEPAAEITSALSIVREVCEESGEADSKSEAVFYLLASDTIASVVAAELLGEHLKTLGLEVAVFPAPSYLGKKQTEKVDFKVVEGLQVSDGRRFQEEGMRNLLGAIREIAGGYYRNLIFNITGGYKATIPYLSVVAMLKAIPVYYIFEDSQTLIRIPPAPVSIEYGFFEKYAHIFQKANEEGFDASIAQIKQEYGIGFDNHELDLFLYEVSGSSGSGAAYTGLSPLGEFFWEAYQAQEQVWIYRDSGFSKLEPSQRRTLLRIFSDMVTRLKERVSSPDDFWNLSDPDIKHVAIDKDSWVFKASAPEQVRVWYCLRWPAKNKFEVMALGFAFITSRRIDLSYSGEFEREAQRLRSRFGFAAVGELGDEVYAYFDRIPL